jgi:hypothetical protein
MGPWGIVLKERREYHRFEVARLVNTSHQENIKTHTCALEKWVASCHERSEPLRNACRMALLSSTHQQGRHVAQYSDSGPVSSPGGMLRWVNTFNVMVVSLFLVVESFNLCDYSVCDL